jgi:hypothetical protein
VALLGTIEGWTPAFTKAVYEAEFGHGRDISDGDLIAEILSGLRLDATSVLRAAQSDENKARLRAQCDEARERGIFGAPTFIAPDGEMFWGNDRLDRALAWVTSGGKGVRHGKTTCRKTRSALHEAPFRRDDVCRIPRGRARDGSFPSARRIPIPPVDDAPACPRAVGPDRHPEGFVGPSRWSGS